MKTELEIRQEIKRLQEGISLRRDFIVSDYVDDESKIIYTEDIKEAELVIERLNWVLD